MSSPSWTSGDDLEDRSPVERHRASPVLSPSPPLEWSESEGNSSAARQPSAGEAPRSEVPAGSRPPAGGRAPSRRRRTAAGTSSRVGAESPEGTASTVTGQDLTKIRARYHIPPDVGLFLPTPDDRVISSRPGRVAVYDICLRVGLRPPFPLFFVNLLEYYSLTPSQLVPNSLRVVCAFIILCHHLHITPRITLFRAFYILRSQKGWWLFQPRPNRVLRLLLPSSVKGWKSRFFFADLDQVRPRWGDPDLRGNAVSAIQPGDREAFGQLLAAKIPRYTLLLTEGNLQSAGLISHRGKPFSYLAQILPCFFSLSFFFNHRNQCCSAMKPTKIPTHKLARAAARKRSQAGPSGERQPPAPKRPRVRVSGSPVPRGPPAAPEIDLTADTPPERVGSEERAVAEEPVAMVEPAVVNEPAALEEPVDPCPLTPLETVRDWGEGPSRVATPPPEETPGSPPPTGTEGTRAAPGRRVKPLSARASVLNDLRWSEQLLAPVFSSEVQEELSQLRAATFYREAYAAVVKVANSLMATRDSIHGGKMLLREIQNEAREALARAEAAEGALESAKTARADELRAAEARAETEATRLRAALSQLMEAENAVAARDILITDLTASAQSAEEKASAAEERVKLAEERVKMAEERIAKAEEEAGLSREAERTAAAALAAEEGVRTAEVEAVIGVRTAKAIEDFKASSCFTDELAEASSGVFLQGFQYAKEKIARDLDFPPALDVELEDPSEIASPGEGPTSSGP